MSARFPIEVWSTFQSAGGTRLGWVDRCFQGGELTLDVFGEDEWRPTFLRDGHHDALLEQLRAPHVLRCTLHGMVIERVILSEPSEDSASPIIAVETAPAWHRLVTMHAIRQDIGGTLRYRFSETWTIEEWFAQRFLPSLALDGVTDIELGTVEFPQQVSLDVNRWTPLYGMRAAAAAVQGEMHFERYSDAKWRVHYLKRIGSSKPTTYVLPGRNLLGHSRNAHPTARYTEVVPFGEVPASGIEDASIAENVWKVENIVDTNWVQLRDRNGDLWPIQIDDMFGASFPAYLVKTDNSTTLITGARASDSAVQVASTTGIAADDDVSIVRTADGDRLTALRDVNAVEEHGLRTQHLHVADGKGERQYHRNALLTEWDTNGVLTPTVTAAINGTHQPSALDPKRLKLKGFPASYTLQGGATFYVRTQSHGMLLAWLTGDKTANGSGEIDLGENDIRQFAVNAFTTFDPVTFVNNAVVEYYGPHALWATGFQRAQEANVPTPFEPLVVQRYTRNVTTLTGKIAANVSAGDGTIQLQDLAPNTRIHQGDVLVNGATARSIARPVITSPTGTATVSLWSTWPGALSSGANITIEGRHTLPLESPCGDALQVPLGGPPGDPGLAIAGAQFNVKVVPAFARLWITSAWYFFGYAGTWTPTDDDTAYEGFIGPGVQLAKSDNTIVDTLRSDTFDTDDETLHSVQVTKAVDLTEDFIGRVRALLPWRNSIFDLGIGSGSPTQPRVWLRYLSVSLSPDSRVPLVIGADADQLWHAALRALLTAGDAPVSFEISLVDLRKLTGAPAHLQDLSTIPLGGEIVVPGRESLRIMGLRYPDPRDPSIVNVLVGRAGSIADRVASGGTLLSAGIGTKGEPGKDGKDGKDGKAGADGADGATGAAGIDGEDGDSAYTYIAYASDDSGTGFTTTFNPALDYIAIKSTTSPITSPAAGDFTGLWKKYKGEDGEQGAQGIQGEAGENGASAYVYIAYASDASGTGFTMTFNASLDYVAIKTTTSPIGSPSASDFTGLWKKYKGEDGEQGSTGATGAAGADGTSFVHLGDFSGASADPGEAVRFNNHLWICHTAFAGGSWPGTSNFFLAANGINPRGTWVAATNYAVGDYVRVEFAKQTYLCHTANSDGTFNATKWHLITSDGEQGPQGNQGPQGEPGADGSSLNWRDDWENTSYAVDDAVFSARSSWRCVSPDSSGVPPELQLYGEKWVYVAQGGEDGETGGTGATGSQGPPGADGMTPLVLSGTGPPGSGVGAVGQLIIYTG